MKWYIWIIISLVIVAILYFVTKIFIFKQSQMGVQQGGSGGVVTNTSGNNTNTNGGQSNQNGNSLWNWATLLLPVAGGLIGAWLSSDNDSGGTGGGTSA